MNFLTRESPLAKQENSKSLFPTFAKLNETKRFLPIGAPTIPFDERLAKEQLAEMQTQISLSGMRLFLWYFNKTMRQKIQGIFVDIASIKMVKDLISANHKVIIMPLYKSFADFFVQTYVARTQGIEAGFTFGNFEDTPRIKILDALLRQCGYIFSRRSKGQSL